MWFTESDLMHSPKQVTKSIQIDCAIDFSACKFVWIAALYLLFTPGSINVNLPFFFPYIFIFFPDLLYRGTAPLYSDFSLLSSFLSFFPFSFFSLPSSAFCQSRNVFISHSFLISAWFPLLLCSVCMWYRAAGGYKTCTHQIKVLVCFVSTYKVTFGCIYHRRNCKWDK